MSDAMSTLSTTPTINQTLTAPCFGSSCVASCRDPVTLFFTIGLPGFLFLIFGTSEAYAGESVGNGNVGMAIMIAMAAYGAVTATVGIGGIAAVERSQGWGRQLGLTPLRDSSYVMVKVALASIIALAPIALIYALGTVTGAEGDGRAWVLSAVVLVARITGLRAVRLVLRAAVPVRGGHQRRQRLGRRAQLPGQHLLSLEWHACWRSPSGRRCTATSVWPATR